MSDIKLDIPDITVVINNGEEYLSSVTPGETYQVVVNTGDNYNVNLQQPHAVVTNESNYYRSADFATSASYALTASYILGDAGVTDWSEITNKPSGLVSSSTQVINHINGATITPLSVLASSFTGSFTGSFYGDGSNLNFTTLNTNQASDSQLVVGNIYNNYQNRQKTVFKKGDIEVSGSVTISNEGLLILTPRSAPIPAVGGGFFYSSSGEFFVGTPL